MNPIGTNTQNLARSLADSVGSGAVQNDLNQLVRQLNQGILMPQHVDSARGIYERLRGTPNEDRAKELYREVVKDKSQFEVEFKRVLNLQASPLPPSIQSRIESMLNRLRSVSDRAADAMRQIR